MRSGQPQLNVEPLREVADRWFRRISTRWAHPDTRYLDLGEQAAVFWKRLSHGLSTGDPVAGEVFPLITPAPSRGRAAGAAGPGGGKRFLRAGPGGSGGGVHGPAAGGLTARLP